MGQIWRGVMNVSNMNMKMNQPWGTSSHDIVSGPYQHGKRQQNTPFSSEDSNEYNLGGCGGACIQTQEETQLNKVDPSLLVVDPPPPHPSIHTSMQTVVGVSCVMGKKEQKSKKTRKTVANHCYLAVIRLSNAQTHVGHNCNYCRSFLSTLELQ